MRIDYHIGSFPDVLVPLFKEFEDKVSPKVNDCWTADALIAEILNSDAGVWSVSENSSHIALVVSRVVYYGENDGPWLEVPALVGSRFEEWIDGILANLFLYVGQERMKGVRAICRPGMSRWLVKRGFLVNGHYTEWNSEQKRQTNVNYNINDCAA